MVPFVITHDRELEPELADHMVQLKRGYRYQWRVEIVNTMEEC